MTHSFVTRKLLSIQIFSVLLSHITYLFSSYYQLYVGCSRVGSWNKPFIMAPNEKKTLILFTQRDYISIIILIIHLKNSDVNFHIWYCFPGWQWVPQLIFFKLLNWKIRQCCANGKENFTSSCIMEATQPMLRYEISKTESFLTCSKIFL